MHFRSPSERTSEKENRVRAKSASFESGETERITGEIRDGHETVQSQRSTITGWL